jgi:peptidoglycan/xylan/chitin deacetylase (PgdA/CDA1 family)
MKKVKKVIKYLLALGSKVVVPLLPGEGEGTVAILTMHSVRENPLGMPTILRPALFEAMIAELSRNYAVVSLAEAMQSVCFGGCLEGGCRVAISFDDGYLDNLTTVLPILERYSVPATVFVTTGSIRTGILHWDRLDNAIKYTEERQLDLSSHGFGKYPLSGAEDRKACIMELHTRLKGLGEAECGAMIDRIVEMLGSADKRMMLDERALAELAASPYVTIGSHTVSHSILTRVSPEQVDAELVESRCYLEKATGRAVTLFAYPNGNHDANIIELLKKNGFTGACTTESGVNGAPADPFRLKRIDVTADALESPSGRFSPAMFHAMMHQTIPRLRAALGR